MDLSKASLLAILIAGPAIAQTYMGRAVLDPTARQPGQALQTVPPGYPAPTPTPSPPPEPPPPPPPPINYIWQTSQWEYSSACSSMAILTRTVTCVPEGGPPTPVDDSFCDASTRPNASQGPIVANHGCTNFRWAINSTMNNNPAMGDCIGGQISGSVPYFCMNNAGDTVLQHNCTSSVGPVPPPLANIACTPQPRTPAPGFLSFTGSLESHSLAGRSAWVNMGIRNSVPTLDEMRAAMIAACNQFTTQGWAYCARWHFYTAPAPGGTQYWLFVYGIEYLEQRWPKSADMNPIPPGTTPTPGHYSMQNAIYMPAQAAVTIPQLYPAATATFDARTTIYSVSR